MTPAARLSAAIEVLDATLAGHTAEHALTAWGRQSRFAGSGDRAAVRDLVFDALRRKRSAAWVGGAESGRGLVLGLVRLAGDDPARLFTGEGHAPPPPGPGEGGLPLAQAPEAVRLDVPDWLLPRLRESLGDAAGDVLSVSQSRAPVWLRVNMRRATPAEAAARLAEDGIITRPHPEVANALEVTGNPRRIAASRALAEGLIEVQDAASQRVALMLGDVREREVLDYCAGGGGKALHLADLGARVTAHDAAPGRMRDIAPRAARAGVTVRCVTGAQLSGRWPLVLVDAPCSGSGRWRRDPEAKWALSPERLTALCALQDEVLARAADLTAPEGRLAYVTCSILSEESDRRARAFLAVRADWRREVSRRFLPGAVGDGFSVDIFARMSVT